TMNSCIINIKQEEKRLAGEKNLKNIGRSVQKKNFQENYIILIQINGFVAVLHFFIIGFFFVNIWLNQLIISLQQNSLIKYKDKAFILFLVWYLKNKVILMRFH